MTEQQHGHADTEQHITPEHDETSSSPGSHAEPKHWAWVDGREVRFSDPVPIGSQMLAVAGLEPTDDYVLIEQLPVGSRLVSADEAVDLRHGPPRRFYAFQTDRVYLFTVNDHGFQWGRERISEEEMRQFARVPDDHVLVLQLADAAPRILEAGSSLLLSPAGTEHLRTQARHERPEHHPEPPRPAPPPPHEHKLTLVIVVNGQPVDIEVNEHAPLGSVIERALHLSGNDGQPPDAWQLRDAAGAELDLTKQIGEYHFAPCTTLFLNLKAGVGG